MALLVCLVYKDRKENQVPQDFLAWKDRLDLLGLKDCPVNPAFQACKDLKEKKADLVNQDFLGRKANQDLQFMVHQVLQAFLALKAMLDCLVFPDSLESKDCLVKQVSQAQSVHLDFPDLKESLVFQDYPEKKALKVSQDFLVPLEKEGLMACLA